MSSAETPPLQTLRQSPPTQLYHFRDYNPIPKVSYIQTLQQATAVFGGLLPSGPLGFDLEWRPTYKKGAPENPVALIQLANEHSIMLFQVSCMRGRHYTPYPSANQNTHIFLAEFPSELKQVLESPHIVKAGVGIQGLVLPNFKSYSPSTLFYHHR